VADGAILGEPPPLVEKGCQATRASHQRNLGTAVPLTAQDEEETCVSLSDKGQNAAL
jgi:hypothetical protein